MVPPTLSPGPDVGDIADAPGPTASSATGSPDPSSPAPGTGPDSGGPRGGPTAEAPAGVHPHAPDEGPTAPDPAVLPVGVPATAPGSGAVASVVAPETGVAPGSRPEGGSPARPSPLRPLGHEAYHAVVQDRMADLETVLASRATAPAPPSADPLAPDEGLLVALDVDGTILSMDGRVSERVMASVARLRSYGAQIVIATGRSVEAALPVARHVGLTTGWMVCANGALTLRLDPEAPRGYEVVTVRTFDPAHAIDALLGAVPDGIVAVERADGAFCVSSPFPPGELIEDYRVVPVEELRSQEVTRVVLRAPGMPLDRFTALVRECGLHSVEYAIGWTAWLDVAPPGVTKASALDDLVVRLGTGPQRAIAVGDGSNDTEMLVWAGVGVAMGSAPQWVRDLADVTTEPVWRDGAAAVLDAVVERVRKQ